MFMVGFNNYVFVLESVLSWVHKPDIRISRYHKICLAAYGIWIHVPDFREWTSCFRVQTAENHEPLPRYRPGPNFEVWPLPYS